MPTTTPIMKVRCTAPVSERYIHHQPVLKVPLLRGMIIKVEVVAVSGPVVVTGEVREQELVLHRLDPVEVGHFTVQSLGHGNFYIFIIEYKNYS